MKTSLGDDALLLDSFHGHERVTAHSEVIPQRLPPRMPKTATDMVGYQAGSRRRWANGAVYPAPEIRRSKGF